MGDLDGKVAIVTGASRGLGKDVAVALGAAGASVVVAARTADDGQSRIPGTLAHTAGLVEEAGGRALAVRCDVGDQDDVAAAVEATKSEFGRIDILVNNAGILTPGSIMETKGKHWWLIFRINVDGPFNFCRAVMPHIVEAGGGHIINVSSMGAVGPGAGPYDKPRAGGTAYGATKAALERFTQGLASEVYQDKVSVNALSPYLPIWSEGGHFFRSNTGEPDYSGWRLKGDVFGDAAVVICRQTAGVYTGNILYDELVMAKEGGVSAEGMATRYPVEP